MWTYGGMQALVFQNSALRWFISTEVRMPSNPNRPHLSAVSGRLIPSFAAQG
jgi:hypothetical protein